jgi:hypothetical protein
MKLLSLEIPDEPTEVPQWLEGHLLSPDLAQLVAELDVLSLEGPSATLDDVLGEKRVVVLHRGLASLSRAQLRQLLGQPELLVELQQLVLDEGGNYWMRDLDSAAIGRETWAKLQSALAAEKPKSELPQLRPPSRHPWLIAGVGWLTAVAALVFGIFIQGNRIAQLQDRLIVQSSKTESLLAELRAEKREHPSLGDPDDTPEPGLLARDPDNTPEPERGTFVSGDDTPELTPAPANLPI